MRRLFGLLFFVCSISPVFCQYSLPPVYEIKTDTAYAKIPDSCWQMLEDAKGKWTIDHTSQLPVSKNFHPVADLNSSISTYWIRFRLKNDMLYPARVYFRGYASFFDLYTRETDDSWLHQKTGSYLPWSKRDGIKNNYSIPLVIDPGQELLVYQRLKFDLTYIPSRIRPGIASTEQLFRGKYIIDGATYFSNIRGGIAFGIAVLAAILSFLFFLAAGEWVYFHASMTYLSLALVGLTLTLSVIYFRENQEMISIYGQYFFIPVFLFFLVSTVRHSLETKRLYPRWDRFLAILSAFPIIFIIAQSFYPSLAKWFNVAPAIIFLVVIITALTWVRKKNKTAKLLIAGILSFAGQVVIESSMDFLNIPHPVWLERYSDDIVLIIFLWIIATSSWLLFQRYRQMQKKLLQEAFEKEQLAKEREIERRQLMEKQKVELEQQVTERTAQLKQSLEELKSTQKQLIQSEKMASLGELTAGIAHEIQNPLNFVNNFSEVNNELIEELQGERSKGKGERNDAMQDEIISDIKQNLEKINHHGKRADAIVKGMLQHSRTSGGQKEVTDINALCDEYLRLAYHGLRAKDKSFNAEIITDFDNSIGKINIVPQDIGRVLLNLINNAFYAVNERQRVGGEGYKPVVSVGTKKIDGRIQIRVSDNGNGIPDSIKEKIFQPFFTTKPTGQGTGLGLSLAYDIIKAHGGDINLTTEEGVGSEFVIQLPTMSTIP